MRDREEKGTEEVEVGGVEVVGGGGEGPTAGGDGGSGGGGGSESSSYTDLEVLEMSPDRQREAAKRGTLTSPQMLSVLGGPFKTHKELIRSLLLATVTAVDGAMIS